MSPPVTGERGLLETSGACALVLPLQLLLGMLIREVPCRRPDRALTVSKVLVAMLASSTLAGVLVGPRVSRTFGESKLDVAKLTIKKYAYEAYPSWRGAHPDQACPPRLADLNEYMNNKDVKDTYGHDYEMYCGLHGIVVRSLGEDGRRNTKDDLWSNQ